VGHDVRVHEIRQKSHKFLHKYRVGHIKRGQLTFLLVTSKRIYTRGQSNLTKSASRGAHSPVRGHPRGSKFVPLNSWVGVPISVP